MNPKEPNIIPIAIFASGTGTNARNIIHYFKVHKFVRVALLVSNKPDAGALTIAQKENIPTLVIDKERFFRGDGYVEEFLKKEIRFIVLAGFLWKIPITLIRAYPNRIINIHPALLPNHGGKGMYGSRVHEAVIAAGESKSGITIHFVDEVYDHGEIIFQATCDVHESDNAESLAKKIHELEYTFYPKVIEQVIHECTPM